MSSSSTSDAVKITITSYSYQLGRLNPPPHLKYDLRSLPNPTRELRANYDGRHKRLRGYMMEFPGFVALLNTAFEDIVRLAAGRENASAVLRRLATDGGVRGAEEEATDVGRWGVAGCMPNADVDGFTSDEDGEARGDSDGEDGAAACADGSLQRKDSATPGHVRVGVFCVRGRHRSAAFAEQLARMEWPRGYDVRVEHRDVDKKRASKARTSVADGATRRPSRVTNKQEAECTV